jgi:hypothetical protein
MAKKKAFLLYHDSLDVLSELSDEQAGQLFKAITSYQKTGSYELSGLLNAVFIHFKNQFDRDGEVYEKVCERNKNNGLRGGRPKSEKTQSVILGLVNNPDKPTETQSNPKKPDKDKDTKKDKDTDKDRVTLKNLSVDHISEWLTEKRVAGKYLMVDEFALLEKFKDYCQAKDVKYKDYIAAYRNSFRWENPPTKKQEAKHNDWSELYRVPQQY